MVPLFIVTKRFGPHDGDVWRKYIEWSKLTQLDELVSLDGSLCEHVVEEILDEDWAHILNEDCMLHYFTDVDYLLRRCGGAAGRNLLCVFRNPDGHPTPSSSSHGFRFLGCDLIDSRSGPSALTNCDGFPLAFSNNELTAQGLLPSLARAREVQQALVDHYPEEGHARCDVWAVFRATQQAPAADGASRRG